MIPRSPRYYRAYKQKHQLLLSCVVCSLVCVTPTNAKQHYAQIKGPRAWNLVDKLFGRERALWYWRRTTVSTCCYESSWSAPGGALRRDRRGHDSMSARYPDWDDEDAGWVVSDMVPTASSLFPLPCVITILATGSNRCQMSEALFRPRLWYFSDQNIQLMEYWDWNVSIDGNRCLLHQWWSITGSVVRRLMVWSVRLVV